MIAWKLLIHKLHIQESIMTDFEKSRIWMKIAIAILFIYSLGGIGGLWIVSPKIVVVQIYWAFVYVGGFALFFSVTKFLYYLRKDDQWQIAQGRAAINWHLRARRESIS